MARITDLINSVRRSVKQVVNPRGAMEDDYKAQGMSSSEARRAADRQMKTRQEKAANRRSERREAVKSAFSRVRNFFRRG